MIFEAFSRPKARDLSVPSDDVLLHIPGRMTGVFDGASDSLGRRINGVPVGRLAAMAAAHAAAALPTSATTWTASEILSTLSAAIAAQVPTDPGEGPASTTAMIALFVPEGIRLLGIGDTGYRINGGPVCVTDLAPDRASIPARVALFELFRQRGLLAEDCEARARLCIGKGLDFAITSNMVSQSEADQILQIALSKLPATDASDDAIQLIRRGLQSQHQLANAVDAQLGYGVLNGDIPAIQYAIDQTFSIADLSTIEIFSDEIESRLFNADVSVCYNYN